MHFASMLHQASSLTAAADRLLVEEPIDEESHNVFVLEALILTALAAETALKAGICRARNIGNPTDLKALIRAQGKGVSPHDLVALFGLLSQDEQEGVREGVLDTISQTQEFIAVFNQDELKEVPPIELASNPSTFVDQLGSVSRIFEEWRYRYELPLRVINATFLRCFADAAISQFQGHQQTVEDA